MSENKSILISIGILAFFLIGLNLASAALQTTVEPTSNISFIDDSLDGIVFNTTWNDTQSGGSLAGFGNFTFEWNATGSFVNDTAGGFGINNRTNTTKRLGTSASEGTTIAWRIYVINEVNNIVSSNRSALGTFTVTRNITQAGNVTETSTSPKAGDAITLNATCSDNFAIPTTILFESGHTGSVQNYSTAPWDSTNGTNFSYTIQSGVTSDGQVFSWRSICFDSSGGVGRTENASTLRTITVQAIGAVNVGGNGGGGPQILPPLDIAMPTRAPILPPSGAQVVSAPSGDIVSSIVDTLVSIPATIWGGFKWLVGLIGINL